MEIILIVALACIAIAAQPFAARRISPLVQGTLGSLCVGISLILTALVASGVVSLGSGAVEKTANAAALPEVELPAENAREESPSPEAKPAAVPNDESKFFEIPADHNDHSAGAAVVGRIAAAKRGLGPLGVGLFRPVGHASTSQSRAR
jgi:hypothetical protein